MITGSKISAALLLVAILHSGSIFGLHLPVVDDSKALRVGDYYAKHFTPITSLSKREGNTVALYERSIWHKFSFKSAALVFLTVLTTAGGVALCTVTPIICPGVITGVVLGNILISVKARRGTSGTLNPTRRQLELAGEKWHVNLNSSGTLMDHIVEYYDHNVWHHAATFYRDGTTIQLHAMYNSTANRAHVLGEVKGSLKRQEASQTGDSSQGSYLEGYWDYGNQARAQYYDSNSNDLTQVGYQVGQQMVTENTRTACTAWVDTQGNPIEAAMLDYTTGNWDVNSAKQYDDYVLACNYFLEQDGEYTKPSN